MSDFGIMVVAVVVVLISILVSSSMVGIEREETKQIQATVELAKINGCKPEPPKQ